MARSKITTAAMRQMKTRGERIVCLTAYDNLLAQLPLEASPGLLDTDWHCPLDAPNLGFEVRLDGSDDRRPELHVG